MSSVIMKNERKFRKVDYGNLPPEPIPALTAKAEKERAEDRQKRLAQIWQLPLRQMAAYCKEDPLDRKRVACLACAEVSNHTRTSRVGISNPGQPTMPKDDWSSDHFRLRHWDYYFSMVPDKNFKEFRSIHFEYLLPAEDLAPAPPTGSFSAEKWINFDDIVEDSPIMTDKELVEILNQNSQINYYHAGPILIQRFVVVREGERGCLCLGIHTYSRQGCQAQPDQELFSIIHSGKENPKPLPKETGMLLMPVRMKPDHPSTALPSSARIHYGRAYRFDHDIPVQPLGLIHSTAIETLLDQMEANVFRPNPDNETSNDSDSIDTVEPGQQIDPSVKAADMEVVKDMRKSITKVLGKRLSTLKNQPELEYGNSDEVED